MNTDSKPLTEADMLRMKRVPQEDIVREALAYGAGGSPMIESLAKHLQARVIKAERERDEAYALLRIFAREYTYAEIAPQAAFARAAEMTQCSKS
jgi:hypothetical protein